MGVSSQNFEKVILNWNRGGNYITSKKKIEMAGVSSTFFFFFSLANLVQMAQPKPLKTKSLKCPSIIDILHFILGNHLNDIHFI